MEELNLSKCALISFLVLVHLSNLVHIKTLILDSCPKIRNEALGHLVFHTPLTHLSLCNVESLSGDTLIYIVQTRTTLSSLILSECPNLTTKSIIYVAKSLNSNLTALNLSGNYKIEDMGILELFKDCPNLKSLNLARLHKISPAVWSELKRVTLLQSLDISLCSKFAGDLFASYPVFPDLRSFTWDVDQTPANWIQDISFEQMLHTFPNLQYLSLSKSIKLNQPNVSFFPFSNC